MQVIEMAPTIEAVENVYMTKSAGEAVAWPTVFHIFEEGVRDMDIRSGYLPGEHIFGHKTIGAKYLARKNSETLFVLGAGNQAAYQIGAMITAFSGLKKVYVADLLFPENAIKFVSEIKDRLQSELGTTIDL